MPDQQTVAERWRGISTELESFRSGLSDWADGLKVTEVTGTAESGKVVARCGASGDLRALEIDEDFFDDASTRQLEVAITSAVRGAEAAARRAVVEQLSGVTMFGVSIGDALGGKSITDLFPFPSAHTIAAAGSVPAQRGNS